MKGSNALVILAAATLSGCANADHPDGFSTHAPQGWSTTESAGGHVVVHSVDGSEFVMLHPFKSASGASPAVLIGPAVKHLTKLFPSATVSRVQLVANGSAAVAKVRFKEDGAAAEANVLCYRRGSGAMLYAVAAPTGRFSQDRSKLIDILQSCRYAPKNPRSAGPLSYSAWTDPREGAFSVQVPNGWQVVGGAFRFAPIDIRKQFGVASPDGAVKVQYGDARLTAFAAYGPSARMRGLRQLQQYNVNGVTYTVLDPMNGTTFAAKYAKMFLGKKLAGFELTGSKDRPDITELVKKLANGAGVSCGEADFTFNEGGVPMVGAVTATVISIGRGGVWGCIPMILTAPPDRMAQAWDVCKHVGLPRENPNWSARQAETTQQFNQMVARNHDATMAQLAHQYQEASDQLEGNSRHWDNIINGVKDVKDAAGNTYEVPAGSNYYFGSGGGVVGNDTGASPGVDFQPLKEF